MTAGPVTKSDACHRWNSGKYTPSHGNRVTLSVLFGSYDYYLYCLDAKTGKKKWAFEADSYVHCTPCVADGRAVIAGCDGDVRMIDVATGKEQAAAKTDGNFAASPAYADGHVFMGDMGGKYLAVRCRDAKVVWQFGGEDEDEHGDRDASFAAAAVSGERVVFASRSGKVFCVNGKTGKEIWAASAKDGVDSSPVIVGDRVFFGSDDGNLYGVRLADGKRVWTFAAGAAVTASPAVGRGRLVIGTDDGAVYCFGEKK